MSGHDSSSPSFFSVTISDLTTYNGIRAVFVGTAGDIVLEGDDGVQATFKAVAGSTLFVRPRKILSTGTTASNIIGMR